MSIKIYISRKILSLVEKSKLLKKTTLIEELREEVRETEFFWRKVGAIKNYREDLRYLQAIKVSLLPCLVKSSDSNIEVLLVVTFKKKDGSQIRALYGFRLYLTDWNRPVKGYAHPERKQLCFENLINDHLWFDDNVRSNTVEKWRIPSRYKEIAPFPG